MDTLNYANHVKVSIHDNVIKLTLMLGLLLKNRQNRLGNAIVNMFTIYFKNRSVLIVEMHAGKF